MPKFRRIQARVDAEQITPENINTLAIWCGGKVQGTTSQDFKLLVPNVDGIQTADVGDYVLKDPNNRFYTLDASAFNGTFEPVTP